MFSLLNIVYLQCLFIVITLLEFFLIGQIYFYSGWLGANRNVSGKLGMKLAITSSAYIQMYSRTLILEADSILFGGIFSFLFKF